MINLQTGNWPRFKKKSIAEEQNDKSLGNLASNESNLHHMEPFELLNATEEEI